MRAPERPPRPGHLTLLAEGEIAVKGRLPWSSNGTFLVDLGLGEEAGQGVYKPLRGERPLWDYPSGLFQREVAAYVVSDWLGWGLVPETVVRDDAPLGPGSVQRFVEADFDEHYFTLLERPEHHATLAAICTFDLLVNSGDRKAGHCLRGTDGRIWAIDNGLAFHPHPKLRTVIWDFEGRPVPEPLMEDVGRLARSAAPPPGLETLLAPVEIDALLARAAALVGNPVFPAARSGRHFPWPLI